MNRLNWVTACVSALAAMSVAAPSFADESNAELGQRLSDAAAVYHELLSSPDRGVPQALRDDCKCIAVIPHTVKAALGAGARFGTGVMSCRNAAGTWSPPSFITLGGGSFGLQIGAQSSDLVLFFMTQRGAKSLMTSSKFTLGGQASVAAGPLGRSGEAGTDLKFNAEIYSYAKSKGLFAGLSIEGARLAADKKSNAQYYGSAVTVQQLLFDQSVTTVPAEADAFRKALP
jgi:lipid-binding SYLF domain-containing protein